MTRLMLPWLAALLGLGGWFLLTSEAQSQLLHHLVVVGTVAGAGEMHGVLTITGLALHATGHLVATGTLEGTVGTQPIQETVTAMADQFSHGEEPGVCGHLLLDLAPAHLARLGRTVEVARLTLDLSALRGPDALLGQLLCALTYLLENPAGNANGIEIFPNAINPRLSPQGAASGHATH